MANRMPKSCCMFNKRYKCRFFSRSQGLVWNVDFVSCLASMQMTKERPTWRSSCIGSLIGVFIGPIINPSNGFGDIFSVLGASRLFGLGHDDGENSNIPLGHIFH